MKLLSVSVGMPRSVEFNGNLVSTGIFKNPVAGKIAVNEFNLAGDGQADLSCHGGFDKAVYAYPAEHYEFWRGEMPDAEFPFGVFGENLTTTGILENDVCIGDKLKIGTAEFLVTEPRFPCSKLGVRFGRKDIIRKFHKARKSGFYLAILQTGELGAGDAIEFTHRDERKFSILDAVRLHDEGSDDGKFLERILEIEALPKGWKKDIKKQLKSLAA